jgi:hypothetical protein
VPKVILHPLPQLVKKQSSRIVLLYKVGDCLLINNEDDLENSPYVVRVTVDYPKPPKKLKAG